MATSPKKAIEISDYSHDLNNTLQVIQNNFELLKKDLTAKKFLSDRISIIESNLKVAVELAKNISGESSSKNIQNENFYFDKLLFDVCKSFTSLLKSKISFEYVINFESLNFYGNKTELFRIIQNLLINAKEAIVDSGWIKLEANVAHENECKRLNITIIDNGCGIEDDKIEKIFNRNFSTKSTETTAGIGLFNVKYLLEKHSGSIKVTSKINYGSTFKIMLPINSTEGDKNIFKTILIADDDINLRESLADLLKLYNYKIVQFSNGIEVIEYLKSEKCDLIILDKRMPELDGYKCSQIIKSQNIIIPIILLTGETISENKDSENFVDKTKVDLIIQKPYDFDHLLSEINRIIN